MNQLEMWLLEKILDQATTAANKLWLIAELKKLDSAVANPIVKRLIEALEAFLALGVPV